MTVRLYQSSDPSAPTLTGEVDSLCEVLRNCLVTGYGSQVGAGWTEAFTGTNKAAFRQGSGSNQFYVRVDDAAPGAGGAKEARVRGYETMSDIDTGTNPAPTVAQQANGGFVRKSNTVDATTRVWVVLADQRTFYMFALTGDLADTYMGWMFGEFYSLKTSDPARCLLIARTTENTANMTSSIDTMGALGFNFAALSMHYLFRDAAGSVGAIQCGKMGDGLHNSTVLAGTIAHTNPADTRTHVAPVRMTHTAGGNTIRGRLRGFWHFGHPIAAVADRDTFDGLDFLSGRTFLILKMSASSGVYCLETSDTWDSN